MQYWNPYNFNTGMNNNLFRDNIVRVNGVAGANAYQMGANERAVLFDENNDYFFMKTTGGIRMGIRIQRVLVRFVGVIAGVGIFK